MSDASTAPLAARGSFDVLPLDRSGVADEWRWIVPYVRYLPETGQVVEAGRQAVGALRRLSEAGIGCYLELEAGAAHDLGLTTTHFVDVGGTGLLTPKGACPAALDGATLRGLPQPCTIEVSDPAGTARYPWSGGAELVLTANHPGIYAVRVLSARCLPGEFEVAL